MLFFTWRFYLAVPVSWVLSRIDLWCTPTDLDHDSCNQSNVQQQYFCPPCGSTAHAGLPQK